jgi:hypothetical protein
MDKQRLPARATALLLQADISGARPLPEHALERGRRALPWAAAGHRRFCAKALKFCCQQPAGDTPGVAAAPVALAGAIVPGVARYIVVLSAHAGVFGVGMTAIVGLMLVTPSWVMSG